MAKADILELKKRLTKNGCTFTKMCGCYVNADKEKILKINESFLNLEEDEFYKFLDIAKKVLSGTFGNNILQLDFKREENKQDFFWKLDKSALKDEELLDEFYDGIIEKYDAQGNYLILIFHDAYDVISKDKNKEELENSDEVYEYILCAICPVELSKANLGYDEEENKFTSVTRDWIVGAVESGFVFPAFDERSADVNSVLCYTKNPKAPHDELMEDILTCEIRKTAAQEKMAFRSVIEDAVEDENEAKSVFIEVQKSINYVISEKEAKGVPEGGVILTESDLEEIVEESNVNDAVKEKIKENFAEEFSKELPSANNILDNKAAETGVQREQVMRLEKQVENLQAAVEKSSRPAEREEIILKVSEERAKSVKTEIIDGVRYVMIPAETGVKMKVNDREFE